MQAIVTIYNESYRPLLRPWLDQIRRISNLPVFILVLGSAPVDESLNCNFIKVSPGGNSFPVELPEHACAEKLRIFEHLPAEISEVLFIDIDVMILGNFWEDGIYFKKSQEKLVISPDLFVGYKEKMEDEFKPFDYSFRMKYFSDGTYYYFNTGVFFASRRAHQEFFKESLKTWEKYVKSLGKYPSIFDQNVFNYCLIKANMPVCPLSINNNCLRQYEKIIEKGKVFLDGKEVKALHFNGGEAQIKLLRWLECLNQIKKTV